VDLKKELHIWRYTLNEQDYFNELKDPLLSQEEVNRYECYLNESDKIRYICNHRFVRQVLSKYLNELPSQIKFSYSEKGKPFIKNSDFFFNYSYRSNYCFLAVTKFGEVGVDIEKMKPLQDAPTFISFSFSEKEKKIIYESNTVDFQETLFTFWTYKEAIIKSLGVGLSADLTQIDLSDFYYTKLNPLSYDHYNLYTMEKINAPEGYKAAFAIKGELNRYEEFEYN
jgi:4'-phosphopantetheinyl transferase